MGKTIAIFSGDKKGGINQFAESLFRSLKNKGYHTFLFSRQNSSIAEGDDSKKYYVSAKLRRISQKEKENLVIFFHRENIKNIIFVSSSYVCLRLSLFFKKNGFHCFLCIHDVIEHETKLSIRDKMKGILCNFFLKRAINSLDWIVLLSKGSVDSFLKIYGDGYANKIVLLTLGAHPPQASAERPLEMNKDIDFLLFFGRIDRYKNLDGLIRSYCASHSSFFLVIAGEGLISSETETLIRKSPKILLMNRFISDPEMIYLFLNCRAVILPYLSATQSGVLPMAYFYSKPVISTNIPNLRCFITPGYTGFLYSSEGQLTNLFNSLSLEDLSRMGRYAKEYYQEYLDWQKNLEELCAKFF
jgi:glycosyltransferase involved in cell wall biosynthesis